MNRFYVVGRFPDLNNPHAWELQGVFDTADAGLKAAHDHDFFLMSVPSNQVLPAKTIVMDVWFPKRQPMPKDFC